ncbi:MAG TPA: hypothetical protein VFX92_05275 [Candidatus Krumholzibacteria bacterium]|nr:hypothetical protein [Candidatus Krumholzibacteria bacterium]
MRQRLVGIIVILAVAGMVAAIAWQRRESPTVRHDRMVRAFIAVLPDSLDSEHRLEIAQLFNMFYLRADKGEVSAAEVDRITGELSDYIASGTINGKDLVHFMADVGYTTYKDDPRYNLEDKSVDHPILNPGSAEYPMAFDSTQYDSAFWADYEKWKKEHPELADSTMYQHLMDN